MVVGITSNDTNRINPSQIAGPGRPEGVNPDNPLGIG